MIFAKSPTLFQPVAETQRGADDAPLWHSVAVTTRADELDRLDGRRPGLIEGIIRLAVDAHAADRAEAVSGGESLVDFAAASSDQVVWDADRVVAVLRVLPDGALQVARFPASGPFAAEGGAA